MPSGPIHVLQMADSALFYGWVVFLCVCVCVSTCVFFIHSSTDGHLNCFHILTDENNTAIYAWFLFLNVWENSPQKTSGSEDFFFRYLLISYLIVLELFRFYLFHPVWILPQEILLMFKEFHSFKFNNNNSSWFSGHLIFSFSIPNL